MARLSATACGTLALLATVSAVPGDNCTLTNRQPQKVGAVRPAAAAHARCGRAPSPLAAGGSGTLSARGPACPAWRRRGAATQAVWATA